MCKRILRPLELCGVRVGRTDHTSYFGLLGGWRGLFHILIFPLLLLASVLLLLLGPGTHLAVIPKIHLVGGDQKKTSLLMKVPFSSEIAK